MYGSHNKQYKFNRQVFVMEKLLYLLRGNNRFSKYLLSAVRVKMFNSIVYIYMFKFLT
jgi:hypothetical protein